MRHGTDNFDGYACGASLQGWTCGVTGKGAPKWAVETDPSAPSAPNVLRQSASGTFPWCVKKGVSLADGFVEVKFKPGKETGQRKLACRFSWSGVQDSNLRPPD